MRRDYEHALRDYVTTNRRDRMRDYEQARPTSGMPGAGIPPGTCFTVKRLGFRV